ncbi:two pore domain potassium channel family protein [Candidatus Woesearchaeota archaeon]|nr:two pore domain potassium channel family protein [Candidatus Woesearchaeota archaeon]
MREHYKKSLKFFERTTFEQCLAFWLVFMFVFGLIYYGLSFFPEHAIRYRNEPLVHGLSGFATAQYFSFITAASASQGYGDIIPVGIARAFAVFEAVCGLLLFGILISKLVSVKQELILGEVYDISFEERLNRLRSGLYLFRADANKIIDKIHLKQITRRAVQDLWLITVTLDTSLHDIHKFLLPNKNSDYIKTLDPLKMELLLNSMELSLVKLQDLLDALNTYNLDWRSAMTVESINSIINTTELVYSHYKNKNLEDIKIIQKLDAIRVVTNAIRERITMANVQMVQQLNLKNFGGST